MTICQYHRKNKEDNEENMDADIRVHRVLDTCI